MCVDVVVLDLTSLQGSSTHPSKLKSKRDHTARAAMPAARSALLVVTTHLLTGQHFSGKSRRV